MILRKKTVLIVSVIAAMILVVVTASSIVNRNSVPKAKELSAPLKHLNVTIDNSMSDIPALNGLDRKVWPYAFTCIRPYLPLLNTV